MSDITIGKGVLYVEQDGKIVEIADVADLKINYNHNIRYDFDPLDLLGQRLVIDDCKHPEDSLVPPPYDGSPADPDDWSCIDCGYRNVSEATRRNTGLRLSKELTVDLSFNGESFRRVLEHLQGRAGVTFSLSTERSHEDQEFLSRSTRDVIFTQPPDVVLTAHFEGISVDKVTDALFDMDTIVKRQLRVFRPRWRMTHETFYGLARADPSAMIRNHMPGIETLLIGNPIEYLKGPERDQEIDLVFTPQSAVMAETDSEQIYRLLNLNSYPTTAITLPTFRRMVVDS